MGIEIRLIIDKARKKKRSLNPHKQGKNGAFHAAIIFIMGKKLLPSNAMMNSTINV
jgi:hypothetical protein